MGQRTALQSSGRQIHKTEYVTDLSTQLSIFLTDFGWFGLLGRDQNIAGLTIGHVSSDEVRETLWRKLRSEQHAEPPTECDWLPEVRVRLQRYTQGASVDFTDCQVDLPPRTAFQRRVIVATRTIDYGLTTTYGQLAEQVGVPRAARAVGSVMATNTVPIIIPCHRVVAAGGKLGGFSAPQGISLKKRMLVMEAE